MNQPQTLYASPLTPSRYDPVYVPSRRSSSVLSNRSSKSTIDILCENAFIQSNMLRKSTSSSMAFPSSSYSNSNRLSRWRARRADSPLATPQPRSQSAMSHISFNQRQNQDSRIYHRGLPSYMLRTRLRSFNVGTDGEEKTSRSYSSIGNVSFTPYSSRPASPHRSISSVDGRDYKGNSESHYFTLQGGKRVSMTEYEK